MHKIEIYTTPTCPDCIFLKGWLNAMALRYVEHDLTQPAIAEEAKKRTGMRIAPITLVDGNVIWGPAAEQIRQIKPLIGQIKAA